MDTDALKLVSPEGRTHFYTGCNIFPSCTLYKMNVPVSEFNCQELNTFFKGTSITVSLRLLGDIRLIPRQPSDIDCASPVCRFCK